jgi:protein-S-isoprenylcysteine O-methyltransferase Ste14
VEAMTEKAFTNKKAAILIIIGTILLVIGIVGLIVGNNIYPTDAGVGEALFTAGLCFLIAGILLDGIAIYRLIKK